MVRGLSFGLRHFMEYDREYLIDLVCLDSRGEAILDILRGAGPDGLMSGEIYAKVRGYGSRYHHVTCRIQRMNMRMQQEIGQRVADEVGRNWGLKLSQKQNSRNCEEKKGWKVFRLRLVLVLSVVMMEKLAYGMSW